MASTENKVSNIDLAEEINTTEPVTNGAPEISVERRDEIEAEIKKLEDDINTLRMSLQRKEKKLADLRVEIGDTRWNRLQNSNAVNKSKQVLSDAGQKTSQAFKSLGTATASKWNEIRESPRVATVSERFWSTTGVMKAKLIGEPPKDVDPPTSQIVQPTPEESNA